MVFCLRSAQPQTIKAAHCSPYFLYQYVCLSSCRSVCPSVCLSIRRWGFVCAQLEHKLAGCSLPPARAPGFKLQTADRRQWPPSHPTPPYYTCQLRRPEYVSYTWKLTLCMLVMVIWALQVSTPILWLFFVSLRCSRSAKGRRRTPRAVLSYQTAANQFTIQLPITAVEGGGLSRIHYPVGRS